MNELMEALNILEKEKDISKDILLDAIENSLIQACKSHFNNAENIRISMNRETCEYKLYAEKTIVEDVTDPDMEIGLEQAKKLDPKNEIGGIAYVPVDSKSFGRISTQNAKNVILQKIREEERKVLFEQYYSLEKEIVTGVIQKSVGNNISVNLGKCDALLPENEQVPSERFEPTQRVKVYILEVKNTNKGPRIQVSRTHPELVKRLFEMQVAEVKDGTVEIKGIAREAGSRTKMAVWSNDPNVDAVGACVGVNGERVNAVNKELNGEKIDIIYWDPNPAILIENALNPAQVICVIAEEDEKVAQVIVPDSQLSLAIGKVGQNARLAAKLTGFKIDIKSETEALECGLFDEIEGYDTEFIGYEESEVEVVADEEDGVSVADFAQAFAAEGADNE